MSMSLSSPSTSSGSIYQRGVRRPPPPSGPRLRGRQSSALATPITLFDSSYSTSGLSYNGSDTGSPPGTPVPFSPPPSYQQHSQPPSSPAVSTHSNSSSFRAAAVAKTPATSTLATREREEEEEEGMETNLMRPRVGSYIATSSTTSTPSHVFPSTLYTSSPTSSPSPPPQSTSTSPTSASSVNDNGANGNGKGLPTSLSAIEERDSEYPRMKLGDIGEEEDSDGVGVQVEERRGGARVRPPSALQSPLSPISPLSPPPLVDSDDDDLTDHRPPLSPSPSPSPPHPPTPPPLHSYPHSPQSIPSRSATTPTPTTATTPVPKPSIQHLSPPPPINYDSVPLKWKSLPLEAAMWTFTSKELQHIVSRAIRTSARESFIRLLSLNILDNELPNELQRLDHAKLTAQARYRFCVHRRTMLLQAVNACSMQQHSSSNTGAGGSGGHIAQLAAQLSETTAECDQLLEQMMRIVDQQAQCVKLQDVHWASALAVALRKRTAELKAAKERISQLEAELEEAWKEAETIARELDDQEEELEEEEGEVTADITGEVHQQAGEDLTEDLTGSVDRGGEGSDTGELTGDDEDQEEAHVIVAEHLTILKSPPAVLHDLPSLVDLKASASANSSSNPSSPVSTSYVHVFSSPPNTPTPYAQDGQPNTPRPTQHTRYPSAIASEMSYQIANSMDSRVLAASPPPLPTATTAIVAQADAPIPPAKDDDAATIHSVHSTRSLRSTKSAKSTKSTKSVRPPGTSRVSQVFAARRRSIRASLGSLRIPKLRHGSRHASSMSAGGIADVGVGDGDGGSEGKSNRPPVPELPSAYIRKPSVSITTMASNHSKSPSTTLPPSSSSSSVVSPASVRRVFSFGRHGKAQHPNLLLQSQPQAQQPHATLPEAGASPGVPASLRSRKPRMSVDDIQVVPRSPRYDVTPSRPSAVDDIGIDARSGAHMRRRMSGVGGIGGVSGLMKRLEWVMGGEAEGSEEVRAEGAPGGSGGDDKGKEEAKQESSHHPLSATSKALHSLKTSPERLFHRVNGSSSSSTSASSTTTTSTPSPGGILHSARKRYTMSFPLFTGSNTAASSTTIPDSTPPSASTSRLGLGPKMRPASSAQYSN
ncbi:hypothetical protein PC9H_006774 [Pleurotus ostreatus]|uniref:Uncharacterized protein n=1 Tax=Pleurotus ostreatus TaxID=5322 RepID=A0A8H7DT71_PLEOS|nr:uncharacterized protein PC9H_006774 [Pleurotus ostreatus]KAF7431056.1 hypothetical protein PC9H_006774 [Pleurotus ostreatus]